MNLRETNKGITMRITKSVKLATIIPFYNVHGIYDVSDLERKHVGHFFDKDTMRFFKSKVINEVFPSTKEVFFVTSEIDPSGVKAFTVRKLNLESKRIETVGEFHSISSKTIALSMALNLAYESI